MSPPLQIALTALLIGMGVVFFALLLVVLSGRLLINLVNRYAPSPATPKAREAGAEQIPGPTIAILAAVVEEATGARGHISHIEPIKSSK